MANYLAQFCTIKNSCDHLVIAVEDVSDLWPAVKEGFEERLPFAKACLNNKTRNQVVVEKLPAEFILTTDSRLRSRFPQEQSLFWFREPYATVILVTCEDLDEFKTILKPRLKLIVQNDEREWFIVFVSKALPSNDQATKLAKRVFARLEVDFNSKRRERCCKLDLHGIEPNFWEDFDAKIVECIRNTLDKRVQFYEEEVRKLSEQRFMPIWNFCNFFILKESLAFMFDMAHLHEDALREYDELELCYLETESPDVLKHGVMWTNKGVADTISTPQGNSLAAKQREFGGLEQGDDQAMLLQPDYKPLNQIIQEDSFREFEFRQYLFACQSKLLFKLSRPTEVASRGHAFIISFSKALAFRENKLPFCLREVWVITACLSLINSISSHLGGQMGPDVEKDFFRLHGDLYSLSREKFMRLAYLIGHGSEIEKSPVNSAALSMLPWPKPAVWPSVPADASSEVFVKEKLILQVNSKSKHFGIQRKPLPLEPSLLLREANRRRASLSAGNMFELFDGVQIPHDGSGLDGSKRFSTQAKSNTSVISRAYSAVNLENSSVLDHPMRLSEIYVAAEHALKHTISDPELWKSLSSIENFERKYMELTKGAADNYHCSWWKRHGVAFDGEIAAICFKRGNFDLAAKSYEKVCALYAGEGWQDLLAEVLPNLAECQKILNDEAGYLSSCVRLLSLDSTLFSTKERQAFQSEVVRIAHSEMKHPVPLDVSSLITFSGNPGPPYELCDGDPGILAVTVWSGFPGDITLESLSLTLIATFNADEGVKAIKCPDVLILKPGKNIINLALPPQKPGSYVLGVLTGQIGHLRFRSHSFSKGGPQDSDDFMSYEKPTRPVLKVFKPRPLVDISAAISSALLMNELQWIGLIIKPINYSLRGSILQIDTGPELVIEGSNMIEIESFKAAMPGTSLIPHSDRRVRGLSSRSGEEYGQLHLINGTVELPDWASDIATIVWLPVRAVDKKLSRGTSTAHPQKQSVVDGMRTVALTLEFGTSRNQKFERTIAVHFTDPFHVSTRLADKGKDGTLVLQVAGYGRTMPCLSTALKMFDSFNDVCLMNKRLMETWQVILHSQVKASLKINDAWLDLQDGFMHVANGRGRPSSCIFPFVVSPSSRAGMIFCLHLKAMPSVGETNVSKVDSILNIKYEISGSRIIGAHTPASVASDGNKPELFFKSAICLQRPVLDPSLAVGFLPFSSDCLRVGQLFNMEWRVERLKQEMPSSSDEVLYEVDANPENWMVAGRKRGHALLASEAGSRTSIAISCMPLVSGYMHPPQLKLPDVNDANIRCNPPGPHLVCVLPPTLCSSFCTPA